MNDLSLSDEDNSVKQQKTPDRNPPNTQKVALTESRCLPSKIS